MTTSIINMILIILLLLFFLYYFNSYYECFENLGSIYNPEISIINTEQVKLKAFKEIENINKEKKKAMSLSIKTANAMNFVIENKKKNYNLW